MRGEYSDGRALTCTFTELPPRARRIPHSAIILPSCEGTTSACAENTVTFFDGCVVHGNYLRVRGEYFSTACGAIRILELPPRARRIPYQGLVVDPSEGTTSACAENTSEKHIILAMRWNYLRVRGEYPRLGNVPGDGGELPPRARRIPQQGRQPRHRQGTTSACAENTTTVTILPF